MPKTLPQRIVFTIVMATIMVYGMIVYNVALNTGGVTNATFGMALHEMPIMVPVAFVLEFFVVEKLATALAFTFMRPTDRPQFITYAISLMIVCIMCPVMSLVATLLFKEPSFGTWVHTWGCNFPMALCWQMFYCGPLSRFIFRAIFRNNGVQREHNKKLNNGLPILHKVPPKRDYGRYFCIMAEKGGTSHGGLTEKLSLFFHAKKQEVNAYGR